MLRWSAGLYPLPFPASLGTMAPAAMTRFLFVVPPFAGHTNPTVSVASALSDRGHEVAWVGYGGAIGHLLPVDAKIFDLGGEMPEGMAAMIGEKAASLRGLENLKFFCEDVLLPLASSMREGVDDAIDRYLPDVLVVDQQALAGAVAARRRDLPWATFSTTSADLRESLAGLPKIVQWFEDKQVELQSAAGLDPVAEFENSPHLVVMFSTRFLIGDREMPPQFQLVGPAVTNRPQTAGFPWEELDDRRKVLVSLGTLNAQRGERLFGVVKEALGDLDVQVLLVAPDEFGPFPDNFIARPFLPQMELLPRVDAVVCHAGHNTVCESLLHGIPLIVTPIKDDQTVVAQQVVEAGAGVRLRFARVRAARLRGEVERVLSDPSFREAAERGRVSFREAGGAQRAADLLEGLS